MNERIRELAKQAYEDVIENTPSFLVTKELYEQKFAELIIQDCVGIANAYVRTEARPTARSAIGREIQRHFGVEE